MFTSWGQSGHTASHLSVYLSRPALLPLGWCPNSRSSHALSPNSREPRTHTKKSHHQATRLFTLWGVEQTSLCLLAFAIKQILCFWNSVDYSHAINPLALAIYTSSQDRFRKVCYLWIETLSLWTYFSPNIIRRLEVWPSPSLNPSYLVSKHQIYVWLKTWKEGDRKFRFTIFRPQIQLPHFLSSDSELTKKNHKSNYSERWVLGKLDKLKVSCPLWSFPLGPAMKPCNESFSKG